MFILRRLTLLIIGNSFAELFMASTSAIAGFVCITASLVMIAKAAPQLRRS